jgi:endoglucanase
VDRQHNWEELVDSSYFLLETASGMTRTKLPPDWILLNTRDARLLLSNDKDSSFSYDAFRTYWRVALDWELYRAPEARDYMQRTLAWAAGEWNRRRTLPAIIGASGKAKADWEALEMLSAMMGAVRHANAQAAAAMANRLNSTYRQGAWGESNSYYLQNWAWFGNALWDGYLEPLKNAK